MRRPDHRWIWVFGAAVAVFVLTGLGLGHTDRPFALAAGATSPAATSAQATTPLPPPAGSVRLATLPTGDVDPRIAADGDVAAWSTASSITVSAGGQLHEFPLGFQPRDVAVGHASGQAPVVMFAKCPPGKVRSKTRRGTCNLYRLSSLDAAGTPVLLTTLGPGLTAAGANTHGADELAPSLAGDHLLFARWPTSGAHGSLISRNVRTGREQVLKRGPLGSCRKRCAWDEQANGTLETSASATGNTYAQIWSFFGGPEGFGVDSNDGIRVGKLTGKPRDRLIAGSFVDGAAGGGAFFADIQQLGNTTQFVQSIYDPEGPAPAPGSHQHLLRIRGDTASKYDDPIGRRIISAAATPTTLWLILEARALAAGTDDDHMPDDFCQAAVGGCVAESMPLPRFKRLPG